MSPKQLRQAAIDLLAERLGPNDLRPEADITHTCDSRGEDYTRYMISVFPKGDSELEYFVSGCKTAEQALERLAKELPQPAYDRILMGC